jgi:hypothetical protein
LIRSSPRAVVHRSFLPWFLLAAWGIAALPGAKASWQPAFAGSTAAGPALYLPLVAGNAVLGVWRPVPGQSWQIQYSGALDTSLEVQIYNLDLFEISPDLVAQLHSQGRHVICYFSAGSYEDWRPDANLFPPQVLGSNLDDWPGEKWLDIRRIDLLAPVMTARLNLAVEKGCDGVDPDNVDGYTNQTGFPLTYADQLAYNLWLAGQAHARSLSIGLKNDLDQVEDLLPYFDWQLNEQCFQYNECDYLLPFIQANKPVYGIEYEGPASNFCPTANALNFDTLQKRLELDAWRVSCR